MKSVLLSWSGGKDSCMALYELRRTPGIRVEALLTTITGSFDRISMHGVRRALVERQARELGIPLDWVTIPSAASNDEYEAATTNALLRWHERGVATVAFGDLFLEDVRAYRERLLARQGVEGVYPIWGRDTAALIREFVALGFKTLVVCVDPAQLDPAFVGRVIDDQFIADLPPGVDPCGENGEFHTFVFDGPLFAAPVPFSIGETACRDGFWFCDLLPA